MLILLSLRKTATKILRHIAFAIIHDDYLDAREDLTTDDSPSITKKPSEVRTLAFPKHYGLACQTLRHVSEDRTE